MEVPLPGVGDEDEAVPGVAEARLQAAAQGAGDVVAGDGRVAVVKDARDGARLLARRCARGGRRRRRGRARSGSSTAHGAQRLPHLGIDVGQAPLGRRRAARCSRSACSRTRGAPARPVAAAVGTVAGAASSLRAGLVPRCARDAQRAQARAGVGEGQRDHHDQEGLRGLAEEGVLARSREGPASRAEHGSRTTSPSTGTCYFDAHDHARPLRPVAHRVPPHRRRAHGALQLALGAEDGRDVRPPHRGHRPGAQHAGEPARSSSTRCSGSGSTWDEGPGGRRRARAVHADGAARASTASGASSSSARARRTAATAPRRSSTRSARRSRRGTRRPVPVPGHLPRPHRPARPAVRGPLPRARERARHLRRQGLRRGDDAQRRAAGLRARAHRRRAALQLRRRGRRRHHGDHARRARARPHGQHAAADPPLRGVRREGARSSPTCR